MIIKGSLRIVTVAVLGAAFTLGLHASADESAGYPQGCVDCHQGDKVETIGEKLEGLGHRNVDRTTSTVPGDCRECHSEDGGYSLLSEATHIVHYENPDKNAFVQDFGGNCQHCHALDAKTGVVTVKSGPKNW